jgi:hypothetical protein
MRIYTEGVRKRNEEDEFNGYLSVLQIMKEDAVSEYAKDALCNYADSHRNLIKTHQQLAEVCKVLPSGRIAFIETQEAIFKHREKQQQKGPQPAYNWPETQSVFAPKKTLETKEDVYRNSHGIT